jgi:hypothetical protein
MDEDYSGGGGKFSKIFCMASFINRSRFSGVFAKSIETLAVPCQIKLFEAGFMKSKINVPSSY